ncbi:cortexin-2 isoform X1 [Alexandromys fortis]|uniref:cortexin-2 isoform X1 n=1 Tax=Alexandromys fortis TaxID=100897 RepID=UPI002152B19B|nr:cortexin-2 isoform X1 [Microtus fortis]
MHTCTHLFLQTLSRTSFRGCLCPVSHPDTDTYTRRPEKRNPRSCDSLHAGPRNTPPPFTLNRSASTDKPTNKSTGWNSSPWQQTWKCAGMDFCVHRQLHP